MPGECGREVFTGQLRVEEKGPETASIGPVDASPSDIHEAVLALSRSIAGRNDLSSLLSGVAESLQRIVAFDFAALILHDREADSMLSYVLDAASPADVGPTRCLPVPRGSTLSCRRLEIKVHSLVAFVTEVQLPRT